MKAFQLFGLIFLIGTGSVLAQDAMMNMDTAPTTVQLTLVKAAQLALEGNPQIHAADDLADAAHQRVLPSLFPDDPTLMVDTTIPGMQMWLVEEKLGFPGKGLAQADINGALAKKMDAQALDERRAIVLQARQAFWDFYYRQKVDAILQEGQTRWKSLSQIVQSKELSGQWLSVKAIQMQMETAKAVNEMITNSRALKVSQFNLNHLFSLPHQTVYQLGEEPVLPPFDRREEVLVRQAMDQNSELAVYQEALEVQKAGQQKASLDYLPDFDVSLSGIRNPDDGGFSDYGFRLGVSIPLFFPAKQSHMEGAASDEVSAARFDLKGEQNEVMHMVEDDFVNADSAWRILSLYEQGNLLQQVQRAWQSSQLAYRNEEMSLSEFVESFNTYLETLNNYYQAKADYGKALAELDYQAGEAKGDSHEKP